MPAPSRTSLSRKLRALEEIFARASSRLRIPFQVKTGAARALERTGVARCGVAAVEITPIFPVAMAGYIWREQPPNARGSRRSRGPSTSTMAPATRRRCALSTFGARRGICCTRRRPTPRLAPRESALRSLFWPERTPTPARETTSGTRSMTRLSRAISAGFIRKPPTL
jgi:hypothetical protein